MVHFSISFFFGFSANVIFFSILYFSWLQKLYTIKLVNQKKVSQVKFLLKSGVIKDFECMVKISD